MTSSDSPGKTNHQRTNNNGNSNSTLECEDDGGIVLPTMPTRYHIPEGNYRSDIVFIVLWKNNNACNETCDTIDANSFVQSMIAIATNRGHTVIELLSPPSQGFDISEQLLW
jgi:hypothetical protein